MRRNQNIVDNLKHDDAQERADNLAAPPLIAVPPIATAAMASISNRLPALDAATAIRRDA